MRNFVQPGDTLSLVAPYALTAGDGFQVGFIFAVAINNALNGAAVEGVREGVVKLTKLAAQAWTLGQKIYWDNVNKRCDTTPTVGMLIGTAAAVAANPSAVGVVSLGDTPSMLTGPQAAVPDVATANAVDLPTAQALANQLKITVNALLAAQRLAGIIQ